MSSRNEGSSQEYLPASGTQGAHRATIVSLLYPTNLDLSLTKPLFFLHLYFAPAPTPYRTPLP